jgi:hypothetical protein
MRIYLNAYPQSSGDDNDPQAILTAKMADFQEPKLETFAKKILNITDDPELVFLFKNVSSIDQVINAVG